MKKGLLTVLLPFFIYAANAQTQNYDSLFNMKWSKACCKDSSLEFQLYVCPQIISKTGSVYEFYSKVSTKDAATYNGILYRNLVWIDKKKVDCKNGTMKPGTTSLTFSKEGEYLDVKTFQDTPFKKPKPGSFLYTSLLYTCNLFQIQDAINEIKDRK